MKKQYSYWRAKTPLMEREVSPVWFYLVFVGFFLTLFLNLNY